MYRRSLSWHHEIHLHPKLATGEPAPPLLEFAVSQCLLEELSPDRGAFVVLDVRTRLNQRSVEKQRRVVGEDPVRVTVRPILQVGELLPVEHRVGMSASRVVQVAPPPPQV